jgi:hypothetical protein
MRRGREKKKRKNENKRNRLESTVIQNCNTKMHYYNLDCDLLYRSNLSNNVKRSKNAESRKNMNR